jgi:hypothetical protein
MLTCILNQGAMHQRYLFLTLEAVCNGTTRNRGLALVSLGENVISLRTCLNSLMFSSFSTLFESNVTFFLTFFSQQSRFQSAWHLSTIQSLAILR